MLKISTAALATLVLGSSIGQAATRNYFTPIVNGARLDACLVGQKSCGKPAADAFCVVQGFTQALMFQREPVSSTHQLVTDSICEGIGCISFRQIKCITASKSGDLAQN